MIGVFATYFAALISNFSGVIGHIIDYINGYKFTAELAAYLPNDDICLFEGLFTPSVGVFFTTVCGIVAVVLVALLSGIYGFYSGLFGYGFAPATGTDTTNNNGLIRAPGGAHNNDFNGTDNGPGPRHSGMLGGYFDNFNGYCNDYSNGLNFGFGTGLIATTVAVIKTQEIGFNNSLIDIRNYPLIGRSNNSNSKWIFILF